MDIYESRQMRGRKRERVKEVFNSGLTSLFKEIVAEAKSQKAMLTLQSNDTTKPRAPPEVTTGKRTRDTHGSPLSLYSLGSIIFLRLRLLLTGEHTGDGQQREATPVCWSCTLPDSQSGSLI